LSFMKAEVKVVKAISNVFKILYNSLKSKSRII